MQAAYRLLDRDATVDIVEQRVADAAANGARLVVFPEAFVPGTPLWMDRIIPWDGDEEWYARLVDQAIVVPGPTVDRLAEIAKDADVHLVVGVSEREPHGTTIYNSTLYFGSDGALLHRHRKLVPTGSERTVWAMGDGSTLEAVPTELARLGGLICWENYMPLARFHLYAQGIDVWIAPTLATGDAWVASMRHLAREGRMWVVGVNPCVHADRIDAEFPDRGRIVGEHAGWLEEGNTVVVDPEGEIVAGPLRAAEGIVYAEIDPAKVDVARRKFDPVGHYHRPDVFDLTVDTHPRPPVRVTTIPAQCQTVEAVAPPARPDISERVGPTRTGRRRRSGLGALALSTAAFFGVSFPAASGVAAAKPAAVSVNVADQTLTVSGTAAADVIVLRLRPGAPGTLDIDVGDDLTADFSIDRSQFTSIAVAGRGGDDVLSIDGRNGLFTDTETTLLDGGAGGDTLSGSVDGERLVGGGGADTLDGGTGPDVLDGGRGHDVFVWNPGGGNDTLVGGPGRDELRFSGSSANEVFSITSAATGHAVVRRDVASVAVDLAAVELIDVATLGGIDRVNLGDVRGSGLDVDIDLATTFGADDGEADRVVAPPGVTVRNDAGTGLIEGLGARIAVDGHGTGDMIRVAGSSADGDRVTIRGTDGGDAVTATVVGLNNVVELSHTAIPIELQDIDDTELLLLGSDDLFLPFGAVGSFTRMRIDGGPGDDEVTGTNGPDEIHGGGGNDRIVGGFSDDTIDGGVGDDTIEWTPGSDNDIMTGGSGTDHLLVTGAGIGEQFTLGAGAAGHAVLQRDIGDVTLDMSGTERLTTRPLSGADTFNVSDLTGTGLVTATIYLPQVSTPDDFQPDTIIVPATVDVHGDGIAGVVDGLGAEVRVENAGIGDMIRVDATGGSNDVVRLTGSGGDDVVTAQGDGLDTLLFGLAGPVPVHLVGVEAATVDLGAGDDSFGTIDNLADAAKLTVLGGAGDDVLAGGNGADVLDGGEGADSVDGNQGHDTLLGNSGDDQFVWDPGDGSDLLDGGDGVDHLHFNGSNVAEQVSVTPLADGQSELRRDIGDVALHLGATESLGLSMSGGADTVRFGDLSGGDVVTAVVALGALGDADADRVELSGTSGDDIIHVGDDQGAVVVSGLPVAFRIAHPSQGLDVLRIDAGPGDDIFTATPVAYSFLLLDLIP